MGLDLVLMQQDGWAIDGVLNPHVHVPKVLLHWTSREGYVGCMQAAQLKGNTTEVKAQLLRELLTESNAFGYLLGSGGPGGGGAGESFPNRLQGDITFMRRVFLMASFV
jgi:hypothetical protein